MEKTSHNKEYYKKKDIIGKWLRDSRNKNVLPLIQGDLVDIACGDNELVKLYGNGKGVDIIDYGKADIILENYYNLPLDNSSIDTVTIIASLNYFDNPTAVLKEIRRILKINGELIITMPNHYIMKIWHKLREPWAKHFGFSKKELVNLLKKSNFHLKTKNYFLLGLNYIYIFKKND